MDWVYLNFWMPLSNSCHWIRITTLSLYSPLISLVLRYVTDRVCVMGVVPGDTVGVPPIWEVYRSTYSFSNSPNLSLSSPLLMFLHCPPRVHSRRRRWNKLNGNRALRFLRESEKSVSIFIFWSLLLFSYQRYAIVATSETALYANIILKKGVVKPKH